MCVKSRCREHTDSVHALSLTLLDVGQEGCRAPCASLESIARVTRAPVSGFFRPALGEICSRWFGGAFRRPAPDTRNACALTRDPAAWSGGVSASTDPDQPVPARAVARCRHVG